MHLIEWKTPFSDQLILGVEFTYKKDDPHNYLALIAHLQNGLTYKIEFLGMWAYKFTDEAASDGASFAAMPGGRMGCACYTFDDSPWLAEFQQKKEMLIQFYGYDTLRHYVLLSSSEIVEVLCGHAPTIKEIGKV